MWSRGVLFGTGAAAVLTLAGCTGGASTGIAATATATASAEPPAASAVAAAEAAADPALAGSPADAALALALRADDLPAGWSVQANPLSQGAALVDNPSLAGICGGTFTSEVHRTTKHPVVGLDGSRTPQVSAEAIAYDSPAAAATAVQELVQAFGGCPPDEYTFEPGPPADGLAEDSVVFQYRLSDGSTQVVVAQARGQVLSVLIGEDPGTTAAAARSIAVRMAALPAAAIGG
ncbi:hypothetical protein [Modestobacter altitudinis]|uniref:hypothetical protein n=1 Tax=Modestobacter altitudinis TaxID=2213158 RepID=UPI00110CECED|nr:hypothetical protein [Modestobacter altitudinis]